MGISKLSWKDFIYIGFALAVMMSIRDDSREEFYLLVLVGAFFVCTNVKENIGYLKEFVLRYPIYSVMTIVWTFYFTFINQIFPRCDKYAISVFGIIFAGYCFSKTDDQMRQEAFERLWVVLAAMIIISVINYFLNPPSNGRMQLFFINPNIEGYAIIIFLMVSLLFIKSRGGKIFSALVSAGAILCTSSKACSILYLAIISLYICGYLRNVKKIKQSERKHNIPIIIIIILSAVLASALALKLGGSIIQRIGDRHVEAIHDIWGFLQGKNQPVDYSTSTNQRIFDYIMSLELFPKGTMAEVLLGRGLMHQYLYALKPTFIRVFSITTGGVAGPAENTFLSLMYDSGAIAFALYGGIFFSAIRYFIKSTDEFLKKVSSILITLMLLGLTVDMEYLIGIMYVEWLLMGMVLGRISDDEKNHVLIPSVLGSACVIPFIYWLPQIISWGRTILNWEAFNNKTIYFATIIAILVMIMALVLVIFFGSIGFSEILIHRKVRKREWIVTISGLVVIVLGIFISSLIIEKTRDSIRDRLDVEKALLCEIMDVINGEIYIDTYPEVYDRELGGIAKSVFRLRELVAYDNVTILADKKTDSHLFESKGFLYTPISDWDAIYTNDEDVIEFLEEKGYRLTSFCTAQIAVDSNGDDLVVPMYDGRYTATFKLSTSVPLANDCEVGVLKIVRKSDDKVISEEHISRGQFDEDGQLTRDIIFTLYNNGIYDIRFIADGINDNDFNLESVYYTRTPEYDRRIKVNKIGKPSHEEYYDLDGEPYEMNGGYYGVDNEYDQAGNAIITTYLGRNYEPMMVEWGYTTVKREFNDKTQTIRCEYYDESDNKVLALGGKAAEEYEYDERGYVNEIRYYGLDNEPVLYFGLYFCVKKTNNAGGQALHEDYYGSENEPILIQGEYSSVDYIYDDGGILVKKVFYDLNGDIVKEESR